MAKYVERAHEPIVVITDDGMIEASCTCGRMSTVTGRKEAVLRGWDSHLAYNQVSPKNAGRIVVLLNGITDPGSGPCRERDLSEFPPEIAEAIRLGRQRAKGRKATEAPAFSWVVPSWAIIGADGGTTKPELPDPAGPLEPTWPSAGMSGHGEERAQMGWKALAAFAQANRQAMREGHPRLTAPQKYLMERAILLAGGAVALDLFGSRSLRYEFALAAGRRLSEIEDVEVRMGGLLSAIPGTRWRLRRTIAILNDEGVVLQLPRSWRAVLDRHDV